MQNKPIIYDLNHIAMFPEKILQAHGAVEKSFTANEPIFSEGQKAHFFYQIVSGKVHLYNLSEDGKVFIQRIFSDGESFGEPPLLGEFPYPINAVADSSTQVLCLSLVNLKKLLKKHPECHFVLTQKLARRLGYKSKKLRELSSAPPTERVLSLLKHYKKKSAVEKEYTLPLTRKEMAMLTGLRTETVIRVVKRLELEKKLRIQKGKIFF